MYDKLKAKKREKQIMSIGGEAILLASMLSGKASSFIEMQEKAGQDHLNKTQDLLPIKNNGNNYDVKKLYKQLGIKVLKIQDGLFYKVLLPKDWKIKSTDHSMWNELYDNKDRLRMTIFFKAAFYDRSAHFNLVTRYSIRKDYDWMYKNNSHLKKLEYYDQKKRELYKVDLYDGNKILESYNGCFKDSKFFMDYVENKHSEWFGKYDKFEKSFIEKAEIYLNLIGIKNYQNPLLYWDRVFNC